MESFNNFLNESFTKSGEYNMDCSFPKTPVKTKELSLLRVCKKAGVRVTEKKENKSILDYIYIKIMSRRLSRMLKRDSNKINKVKRGIKMASNWH